MSLSGTRLAAALLLAAVAAGCGGAAVPSPAVSLVEPAGAADREAGLAVLRFVQAARSLDTARMLALMSSATRASIGPGAAEALAEPFEGFHAGRVVLALRLDERWAVGAVAGLDKRDRPAAWAAALHLEDGRWRVELGGVFFARLRPSPGHEVGTRPELRAEAQSGLELRELRLWVDGRELAGHAVGRAPFRRVVWGRLAAPLPEGVHTAVAFATAGDTAGAVAWPFEVER